MMRLQLAIPEAKKGLRQPAILEKRKGYFWRNKSLSKPDKGKTRSGYRSRIGVMGAKKSSGIQGVGEDHWFLPILNSCSLLDLLCSPRCVFRILCTILSALSLVPIFGLLIMMASLLDSLLNICCYLWWSCFLMVSSWWPLHDLIAAAVW